MFMDSPPLLCSSLRDRQEGTRADGYSRGEKRKLSHYWMTQAKRVGVFLGHRSAMQYLFDWLAACLSAPRCWLGWLAD